jgi:uncharacterized protein YkwD
MLALRRIFLAFVLVFCLAVLIGCGSVRTYTVQAGDTLQEIALKNNTTVSAIVQLNKERYPSLVTNPRSIRTGWQLQIPTDDEVTLEFESLLMRIARTANPPTPPGPAVAQDPNDKINQVVERINQGINQVRFQQNLKQLVTDPYLTGIAETRSNDMIARDFFAHTDPKTGSVLFQELLRQQGYTYMFAGENIAEIRNQGAFVPAGFTVYSRYTVEDLADQFVTGWVNSPDHYENIINPHFRRTGIAVGVSLDGTRVVATQVFSD